MKILALDPGVTTGYAIGDVDNEGFMLVISGQERYDHLELYKFLQKMEPDAIICESFEFRNKSRKGLILYSLELIGVATLYTQAKNIPLWMQTAAKGKGYYSDTGLKKHEVYKPGRPHANDAVRHLLQWFTFGPGYRYNKKGFESGA